MNDYESMALKVINISKEFAIDKKINGYKLDPTIYYYFKLDSNKLKKMVKNKYIRLNVDTSKELILADCKVIKYGVSFKNDDFELCYSNIKKDFSNLEYK